MKFKSFVEIAKKTFSEWSNDKATKLAAALAYYTVFSLPPLFVIAIGISRLFVSAQEARAQLGDQIGGLLGKEGATAVTAMIDATYRHYGKGGSILATLIGVGALLFGASGVFGELQDSLNQIWKVDAKKTSGVKAFLRQRLLSFSMVLTVGFLLTVSLILSALISSAMKTDASDTSVIWEVINFVASFVVTSALFSLIFKVLPDTHLKWKDVWSGGVLTAVLFTIGKTLIGLYLGQASATSMFGAAGSVLLIFLWVYYTAQILFLGAEYTKVHTTHWGSKQNLSTQSDPKRVQGLPKPSPAH